jgi:hypothetical protein
MSATDGTTFSDQFVSFTGQVSLQSGLLQTSGTRPYIDVSGVTASITSAPVLSYNASTASLAHTNNILGKVIAALQASRVLIQSEDEA